MHIAVVESKTDNHRKFQLIILVKNQENLFWGCGNF